MTIFHELSRTETTNRHLVSRLFASLAHHFDGMRTRRQMKQSVGCLNERELRDIGLTRADVESALQVHHTEAQEQRLSHARRQNSGNW